MVCGELGFPSLEGKGLPWVRSFIRSFMYSLLCPPLCPVSDSCTTDMALELACAARVSAPSSPHADGGREGDFRWAGGIWSGKTLHLLTF